MRFIVAVLLFPLWLSAAAQAATVTLAWDANSETNVAGYIVYWGTTSSNYTCTTNVGNQTTATLTGLTYGTTYYFSATAFDQDGLESDFAPEINYTPLGPPAPAAPVLRWSPQVFNKDEEIAVDWILAGL